MQKVASYCLERRDAMNWPEARVSEGKAIRAKVEDWLESKGASGDGQSGTFKSQDPGSATYEIQRAADGDREWTLYRLNEVTGYGRRFSTDLSVTIGREKVSVYLTMEVGSETTSIRPVDANPRCPTIVRSLLELPGTWYHGASPIHRLRACEGLENGSSFAAELTDPSRTIPFVVVSSRKGRIALPEVDEKLAMDLAGLANVILIDSAASWGLTDALGRRLSCYDGAIRIYWPKFTLKDDPHRHPLWTADRLESINDDPRQTLERFRKQIRSDVMRASALGVVRPKEIDEIRHASTRAAFAEMKAKATSLADYEALADSYANDNDKLREEISILYDAISEMEEQKANWEREKASLLGRIENTEIRLRYLPDQPIAPEGDSGTEDSDGPKEDEIRYYKKKYSTKRRDVMERVNDCGHNAWQGANSADKAKKGIAHFENGKRDWKTIQHCGTCQGGGMWRVKW